MCFLANADNTGSISADPFFEIFRGDFKAPAGGIMGNGGRGRLGFR
jgi:hypothetical protein